MQDGIQQPRPGEIAYLLHKDMATHMKKTADFNDGWKVQPVCRLGTDAVAFDMVNRPISRSMLFDLHFRSALFVIIVFSELSVSLRLGLRL